MLKTLTTLTTLTTLDQPHCGTRVIKARVYLQCKENMETWQRLAAEEDRLIQQHLEVTWHDHLSIRMLVKQCHKTAIWIDGLYYLLFMVMVYGIRHYPHQYKSIII